MENDHPIAALVAKKNLVSKQYGDREEVAALLGVLESMIEHQKEIDEVVDDLITQQGSFLDEGTASQLISTLALSEAAVEMIRTMAIGFRDDLQRRRALELAKALEESIGLSVVVVQEIIDGDDDDDENEGTDGTTHSGQDERGESGRDEPTEATEGAPAKESAD